MSEFCMYNDVTSDPRVEQCGCDGNMGYCA